MGIWFVLLVPVTKWQDKIRNENRVRKKSAFFGLCVLKAFVVEGRYLIDTPLTLRLTVHPHLGQQLIDS